MPKKTTTKTATPKATTKSGAAEAVTTKPANKAANHVPKKLSALDAAAKVLGESAERIATKAMIEAMSAI